MVLVLPLEMTILQGKYLFLFYEFWPVLSYSPKHTDKGIRVWGPWSILVHASLCSPSVFLNQGVILILRLKSHSILVIDIPKVGCRTEGPD